MPYDEIAGVCYNDTAGNLRSWGHGPRFRNLLVGDGRDVPRSRGRGKGPQARTERACANCGALGVFAKNRCRGCYGYRRRHGEERPLRLINRRKPVTGYVT